MSDDFTHFDDSGQAHMVDVGDKTVTKREAIAEGRLLCAPETLALIQSGGVKKGDVFSVARLAGIMGAKQTAALIPLCHPLPLSHVSIELWADEDGSAVCIRATCRTDGKTGVEMEALMGVSVANRCRGILAYAAPSGPARSSVRSTKRDPRHGAASSLI